MIPPVLLLVSLHSPAFGYVVDDALSLYITVLERRRAWCGIACTSDGWGCVYSFDYVYYFTDQFPFMTVSCIRKRKNARGALRTSSVFTQVVIHMCDCKREVLGKFAISD